MSLSNEEKKLRRKRKLDEWNSPSYLSYVMHEGIFRNYTFDLKNGMFIQCKRFSSLNGGETFWLYVDNFLVTILDSSVIRKIRITDIYPDVEKCDKDKITFKFDDNFIWLNE